MKLLNYPSDEAQERLDRIVNRGLGYDGKDLDAVQAILEDVKNNGDAAVIKYTHQYDAPELTLEKMRVSQEEISAARQQVDSRFMRALNRAADQIASFHQKQMPRSWVDAPRNGTLLGQLVHAVEAAGVYVPGGRGGRTPLVSSVLMGAIPAKIAGVDQVVMVTPPTPDGSVSPYLLAAAHKAGVDAVFKAGSAWAIAALAHGTRIIPKVDVIVGPGNIYVTLAKKLVSGMVRIDMIAGPSEILVIADESADPAHVAADLLSQAEHDTLASAILVTDSTALAQAVRTSLERQVGLLDRREIATRSLADFGALIVVRDMDTAISLANRIAPEHLELQIRDPFSRVGEIRHAGAVFIGPHTPEAVGDYMAGPNHVLPTAGTARFSSALSVEHFLKKTSIVHYSAQAFFKEAEDIIQLATIEGLDAHARSVQARLDSALKK